MKNPVKPRNLSPNGSFKYYRLNSKYRKIENTPRALQHRKVTSFFWNMVGEMMIERKGGVLVDKFGYFCIGMVPVKMFLNKKISKKIYLNPHTNSRVYFPLFIPNPSEKKLKVFTMDRNFTLKISKGLSKKLKSGQKYLCYFEEIYKTFLNRYRNTNR